MKPYILIIIFSLGFGLTSVYAQQANTDLNKSELETKTELHSPEVRKANQPQLPGEVLKKPATSAEVKSPEEQRVLNGPRANEPDPSRKTIQTKATPTSESSIKSETQRLKANENPKKNN